MPKISRWLGVFLLLVALGVGYSGIRNQYESRIKKLQSRVDLLEKTITQLEQKKLIGPEANGRHEFKTVNINFSTVVKNNDWTHKINPNFPQYFVSKGPSYDNSILQAQGLKSLKSFTIDPIRESAAYAIHGEINSIAYQDNVINIVVRQLPRGYHIVKWNLSKFKPGKYTCFFKTPNGKHLSNEVFFLQRK